MTTDVAVKEPMDLEQVPEKVRQMLARIGNAATSDTGHVQLDIMERIQEAETEEELFEAANAGTVAGKSVAGRPFLIHEFEWKHSARAFIEQGAFPFYALLRVTMLDTNKDQVLNCGGLTFVSVLDMLDRKGFLAAKMEKLGGYPMVLESRATQTGFDVLIPHAYVAPKSAK